MSSGDDYLGSTGADGTLVAPRIDPGKYRVRVLLPNQPVSKAGVADVEVRADETAEVVVRSRGEMRHTASSYEPNSNPSPDRPTPCGTSVPLGPSIPSPSRPLSREARLLPSSCNEVGDEAAPRGFVTDFESYKPEACRHGAAHTRGPSASQASGPARAPGRVPCVP